MRIPIAFPILSIFFISIFFCHSVVAQSPNDIYGTIENGRYVNNHLKFQLTIPDGWLVVESEEQKAAKQIGLNAVKTGDPKADTLIEKSAKADTLILFVSEKPLGSIENAAFGMSVTNLPSKGYTPKMLAESFKSVFLKNPKNKLVKDISIEKIGDWLWANVQMDLDLFGNLVHTNYFVTVIGDQALVANMSYQNSLQLQKMRTSLDGIRLASK